MKDNQTNIVNQDKILKRDLTKILRWLAVTVGVITGIVLLRMLIS